MSQSNSYCTFILAPFQFPCLVQAVGSQTGYDRLVKSIRKGGWNSHQPNCFLAPSQQVIYMQVSHVYLVASSAWGPFFQMRHWAPSKQEPDLFLVLSACLVMVSTEPNTWRMLINGKIIVCKICMIFVHRYIFWVMPDLPLQWALSSANCDLSRDFT